MEDKIFVLDGDVLNVVLPQGKTMQEINEFAKQELKNSDTLNSLYGVDVKINGRCTTALAILLGHELAHICRSVSIFDPKENSFVLCIKH